MSAKTESKPNPASWICLRTLFPPAVGVLSDDALHELLAAAEPRMYEPGDAMVRQGDQADGLLILFEGRAHARSVTRMATTSGTSQR